MTTESMGKFVDASEWLRRLPQSTTLRASLNMIAACHCIETAPLWARERAVKGMLGCVIGLKQGFGKTRKPTLKDRQTMQAVSE